MSNFRNKVIEYGLKLQTQGVAVESNHFAEVFEASELPLCQQIWSQYQTGLNADAELKTLQNMLEKDFEHIRSQISASCTRLVQIYKQESADLKQKIAVIEHQAQQKQQSLASQLQEQQIKNQELAQVCQSLEQQVKQSSEQQKLLQSQLKSTEQKVKSLESDKKLHLDDLTNQLNWRQNQLDERSQLVQELESVKSKLADENAALTRELARSQKESQSAFTRLQEESSYQLNEARKQQLKQEREIKVLNQEISTLQARLSEAIQQVRLTDEKAKQKMSKLSLENKDLKKLNQSLQTQLDKLQS
ncbi:hypothetical protein [Gayadomonas joobiniege]|uniref:hypothetical protein n=1 Tax=Gayadomonas joobiniege TaxID=1234606 RepID=UPI000370BA2F|nr:hypothetical protein [Gayadomonas joobiniege]